MAHLTGPNTTERIRNGDLDPREATRELVDMCPYTSDEEFHQEEHGVI